MGLDSSVGWAPLDSKNNSATKALRDSGMPAQLNERTQCMHKLVFEVKQNNSQTSETYSLSNPLPHNTLGWS